MAYLGDIESADEFTRIREELQSRLGQDESLYAKCMALFVELMDYRYVYSKTWMGIPIVKLPEDIVVIQEFYYEYKPTATIEVGVARGGSVALATSLQMLNEIPPHVLGLDIKILPHTRAALADYVAKGYLQLVEASSTSEEADRAVASFISGHERVFAILDSDHSHNHVTRELEAMDRLLPAGSVVLVADGIIEHLPERSDRPWGKGNSPYTATESFLTTHANWQRLPGYARRSLMSEFRDGWITKVS